MRAAVTGASGHVGANLVRALLARGHEVTVLVRSDRRGVEGLGVREVQGELQDLDSLPTQRHIMNAEIGFLDVGSGFHAFHWNSPQAVFQIEFRPLGAS